jgi:hypothetical protein
VTHRCETESQSLAGLSNRSIIYKGRKRNNPLFNFAEEMLGTGYKSLVKALKKPKGFE